MSILIAGVVLWTIAHLFPAVFVTQRGSIRDRLGSNAYRGVFSLVILASLLMIVFGWRNAIPTAVYAPPLAANVLVILFILPAIILFAASGAPGNIKRFVRHPQMTGVILWSAGHLLANGDSRSVVLFGGLGIWAILEIAFINRRDGAWEKPPKAPVSGDLITVVIGAVVFAALAYFHEGLSGMPLVFAH